MACSPLNVELVAATPVVSETYISPRYMSSPRASSTISCNLLGGLILKGLAATLAVVVIFLIAQDLVGATTGTSQQRVPQEIQKVSSQVDHRKSKLKKNCDQARPYAVAKRKSTWSWQDKSYVARTRTAYAESKTHGCGYLKWIAQLWASRANASFKKYASLRDPKAAICHIFGSYCSQALAVSRCESGESHSVRAHNGQYLGMFQMGSSERAKYGHGNTPLEQAYAAYLYFVDSGKDWSPWSCKPY